MFDEYVGDIIVVGIRPLSAVRLEKGLGNPDGNGGWKEMRLSVCRKS